MLKVSNFPSRGVQLQGNDLLCLVTNYCWSLLPWTNMLWLLYFSGTRILKQNLKSEKAVTQANLNNLRLQSFEGNNIPVNMLVNTLLGKPARKQTCIFRNSVYKNKYKVLSETFVCKRYVFVGFLLSL